MKPKDIKKMATENGKKANLLNHVSVGHLIDESVFEVIESMFLSSIYESRFVCFSLKSSVVCAFGCRL